MIVLDEREAFRIAVAENPTPRRHEVTRLWLALVMAKTYNSHAEGMAQALRTIRLVVPK